MLPELSLSLLNVILPAFLLHVSYLTRGSARACQHSPVLSAMLHHHPLVHGRDTARRGWPAVLVSTVRRRGGELGALWAGREPAREEEKGKGRLKQIKYNGRQKRKEGCVCQGTAERGRSRNTELSALSEELGGIKSQAELEGSKKSCPETELLLQCLPALLSC